MATFPVSGVPMSTTLRIALAQFDFPVGAVERNADRIVQMIGEARDEFGADVVLFPELAISGYPPEDLLMRPSFLRDCEQALHAIAAHARGIVAVVGWPESAGSVLYNAASVLRDGRVEATYRKRELPNYNVFDERRYFQVDPDGGPLVFEVKGVPVGVVVCEDLWFPGPLAETAAAGAKLVLVPNASPFEHGKHARRDALLVRDAHLGTLREFAVAGEPPWAEFSEFMLALKQRFPAEEKITLLMDPGADYQSLITLMDRVRSGQYVNVTELQEVSLFPNIGIGTAPARAGAPDGN